MTIYFLPPDWRHAHCCELISRRYTNPQITIHGLVRSYLTYLRWLRNQASPAVISRPVPDMAYRDELRLVHRIQYENHCRQLRDELQTRILADQPREAIVNATGLSRLEVTIFEYLFFSIRHRLDQPDYIHAMVIDQWKPTDPEELFKDTIKRLAYGGGVALLDTVLLLGRARQGENLVPPSEYLIKLRDILGRVNRSELQSFLATNSRQGLQSAITELLATLLGTSAAAELTQVAAVAPPAPADGQVDSSKCSIEAAQLAILRAA